MVQVYAPTSTYEEQIAESFYEDVESAMGNVKTQQTVLMGDFNTEVGKEQVRDHPVKDCGMDTKNNRKQLLVQFAELNNQEIMNACFCKSENIKWIYMRVM